MDRREFIRWSATRAGIVALFFVGGAAALIGPGAIVRHLQDTFAYLDLSEADLRRFARAYLDVFGHPGQGQWADVESVFLLSTDFFANGADESRPVRYVTLYDPWTSPCYNPMATFDDG